MNNKSTGITRRQRFAIVAILSGLAMTTGIFWPWWAVMGLLTFLLVAGFIWGVDRDLSREEWFMMPLPLMVALGASYGWLWLYANSNAKWVLGGLGFGLAVYGLLLTLNILNLSRVRTIPLARTATSVLSIGSMAMAFVLYYLVLYWQPDFWPWLGLVSLVTLLIAWPLQWLSMSGRGVSWRSLLWSLLIVLVMSQLASVVAMWPRSFMTSLFLAGSLYVVMGVVHFQEKRRGNAAAQRQYLLIFTCLLVALYAVTSWYGA